AGFDGGVHDLVNQRVVVDRVAVGVFGVDVGGAPLQGRRAVTRVEEKVRAGIHGRGVHRRQRAEQLLSLRGGRVIGLVVPVVRPHALKRSSQDRKSTRL